jgi:hypothetical protein
VSVQFLKTFFLGVLIGASVVLSGNSSRAAVQDDLGVVKAVRRTFTLNLGQLMKQCHEETSFSGDKVFVCLVKEYILNGTENLLQGTAGRQGKVFFYDDAVSTVLEVTPEGYQTKTYLTAAGGDGSLALKNAFEVHKLEGKQITVLVHMVP